MTEKLYLSVRDLPHEGVNFCDSASLMKSTAQYNMFIFKRLQHNHLGNPHALSQRQRGTASDRVSRQIFPQHGHIAAGTRRRRPTRIRVSGLRSS